MDLSFLSKIKINEEELKKHSPRSGGGHRKEWNPTHPNTIRVWRDGSVFPDKELTEHFALEYEARPVKAKPEAGAEPSKEKKEHWTQPGNALDIIDTDEFPVFKSPKRLILANVALKAAGKTDLFGSCGYAEDGKPLASVMEQGASTFGKTILLPMIEEIYGITLDEQRPYIDLVFIGKDGEKLGSESHYSLPGDRKVCFVPKRVSRGKKDDPESKKGMPTVTRREDPWLFILLPLHELHPEMAPKKKEGAKLEVDEAVAK